MEVAQDKRIDSLTGIRALAAGIVVLHHLVPVHNRGILRSILEEFNVGVTIFFVLSGFLITYRYFGKYEKDRYWYYNYAVNRIARIYPMYFFLTLFTFSISLLSSHRLDFEFVTEFLLNITLLRGFFSEYVYTGISQGWTLSVEECFYFSAPLMFLLSKRYTILLQALVIFCTGIIFYFFFRNINFHGFMNSIPHIYITTYFGRIFEFAIGMIMALFVLNDKKIKYATLIGGIGFILIFSIQVSINYLFGHFSIQTLPGFSLNTIVLPVIISFFLFGLIKEESFVKRILQSKVMVMLGKSSYTLYLLHGGVFGYLVHRFVSTSFFVEIILTYLTSIALWHFIEEPCNDFIRQFKRGIPPVESV
jgi:peptidoglycan/LPS O-acetylase OafA/YrhL